MSQSLGSPKKICYCICEGQTEKEYLRQLSEKYKNTLLKDWQFKRKTNLPHTDLKSLLNKAKEESKTPNDMVVIFADLDTVMDEDIEKVEQWVAEKPESHYFAKSKPCFETWLLLHYHDMQCNKIPNTEHCNDLKNQLDSKCKSSNNIKTKVTHILKQVDYEDKEHDFFVKAKNCNKTEVYGFFYKLGLFP
jgi:hypothetical protein